MLPALAPIFYNLGIILGAVMLAPGMGVKGLAVGVVVGALGHLVIQIPGLVRYGLRYMPTLGLHDPSVREVGRLMLPRVVGLAAVQINFLVNTILASGLVAGSLAAINYAIHREERKPGLMVVTDIDQDRLDRASGLYPPEMAGKNGIDLRYMNTRAMSNFAGPVEYLVTFWSQTKEKNS